MYAQCWHNSNVAFRVMFLFSSLLKKCAPCTLQVALQSYTLENVMYHILHQRVPLHSFKHLTYWWEHRTHLYRSVSLSWSTFTGSSFSSKYPSICCTVRWQTYPTNQDKHFKTSSIYNIFGAYETFLQMVQGIGVENDNILCSGVGRTLPAVCRIPLLFWEVSWSECEAG